MGQKQSAQYPRLPQPWKSCHLWCVCRCDPLRRHYEPSRSADVQFQSINWEILRAYYVSGLPMDLIHAAATVIFILIAAEPMLEKLDRIKVKYGLVE